VLKTPILFIIFNRPFETKRVFDSIRKAKPTELYIAADGPRLNNIKDIENSKLTREIIKNIDWDCNVNYLFREDNLGCKIAVSTAINWFFENVEEGIIIEDDCLPNDSFYMFCSILLEKYRLDLEVMHIGGANFQNHNSDLNDSYYFSRITHVWGWATWKSAWIKYDQLMIDYNETNLKNIFKKNKFNRESFTYFLNAFKNVKENKLDTWDYQWTYTVWKENGLAIIPNVNLVSNIGFNTNSTHTLDGGETYGNLKTINLEKILHPIIKVVNINADKYTFEKWFVKRTLAKRLIIKIYKILK
jgi:hypothetical protein